MTIKLRTVIKRLYSWFTNHAISELINKSLTSSMLLSEKILGLLALQNLWLFKTTVFRSFLLFSPRKPEEEDNGGCEDAECEDDTEDSGSNTKYKKIYF